MNLKDARSRLKAKGMTITRTEYEEFRVNKKGGTEEAAYYTNDIDDALNTGLEMARRLAVHPNS